MAFMQMGSSQAGAAKPINVSGSGVQRFWDQFESEYSV